MAADPPWVRYALIGLVLLAAAARLVPTVLVPSLNWGDEVFQTIEPAHRLVYGYGLVAWEFQLGMRSWLLPGVIAGLMQLARAIGDGPSYYLPVIAGAFALLACVPAMCCFFWFRRWYSLPAAFAGAAVAAFAPELIYFGSRALTEIVAAHLLVLGCYLLEPGHPVSSRRRLFAAGLLFGLVCYLRVHLAPAVFIIVIWSLWRGERQRLPALVAGGFCALASAMALDWATLGYPLASVWRNVLYNVIHGVSAEFGVEPWYYYLLGELGIWAAGAPFLLVAIALGARRLPALLAAAIVIIAVHSCIAHKEYRFIYPAVLLLTVLASAGVTLLVQWATAWLRQRGLRENTAAAVSILVVLGYWGVVSLNVWNGSALADLRHRASDNLAAMSLAASLSSACAVGLYGEDGKDWVWYGGYTRLHRPLPMYWPKDEAALTAAAPAFNTLIYTAPPPPELGFGPRQCFGRVCVAERPGICAARAMTGMPFPEELVGLAPPIEKFEAVPRRLIGKRP
jgi:hypothetical protein